MYNFLIYEKRGKNKAAAKKRLLLEIEAILHTAAGSRSLPFPCPLF